MKKYIVLCIVLFVLIFGYSFIREQHIRQTLKQAEYAFAEQKDTVIVGGVFDIYKKEKLAFAKEGKVVLFFNASWCQSCSAFEDELKQVPLPSNVLLLSVDFDQSQKLREQYNVALQHTFIEVDSEGNILKRWSGGGVEQLKKELKL